MRSPTYTLIEVYPLGAMPRSCTRTCTACRTADELEALGLRDCAQRGHVWLVEWPERAAGHLPAPDLDLSPQRQGRRPRHRA